MSSDRDNAGTIIGELVQLVGSWWFHYDEWNRDALRGVIVDDFAFSCRSDTGATEYEDFIRCDVRGADEVMAWQETHRHASPYPLRHNSNNIFVTARTGSTVAFSSYIFVTKIVDGRPYAVSSGLAHWTAQVAGDAVLLASLEVVLDTRESVGYSELSTHHDARSSAV